MSGLQEEYLQHQTKIEQLRLSIQYIRWYLVSLILLCLISAIIFFCYFTSYITNFIWSIGFTILTLTCLLFVPKLLTHYRDIHFIKKTDLMLQGICLTSGILMGINIIVLHFPSWHFNICFWCSYPHSIIYYLSPHYWSYIFNSTTSIFLFTLYSKYSPTHYWTVYSFSNHPTPLLLCL